jgi:hypothetical protein
MGNNNDPVTLHKYLYANANPVTYVDPTGNFSLVSFAAADSIRSILAETTVQAGFSILDATFSDSAESAVENNFIGAGLGILGGAGVKLFALLSKKAKDCIKSNCNFDIWKRITPTSGKYPGTIVPVTFKYSSSSGHSVWINSSGTKHLNEHAKSLAKELSPDRVRLGVQLNIKSLGSAIDTATKNGVKLNTRMKVGGWQLEFRKSTGDKLPVLVHARFEG